MSTNLVKEKYYKLLNSRLDSLKDKIYETLIQDGKHFVRNELINEIQTIKLDIEDLEMLTTENIIFYLNYNNKFAMNKLKLVPYKDRVKIVDKLLKLDLSKDYNLINMADFLKWSVDYICKDKDMVKLVQYFCDNTNYKNYSIIFDIYSIYIGLPVEYKCKEIMLKKHDEITKLKDKNQNIQ